MKKFIIIFLAMMILGTIFSPLTLAEPKFSIGGDLGYGERSGLSVSLELSSILNEFFKLRLESNSSQDGEWIGVDVIYKPHILPMVYVGGGIIYLFKKSIYVATSTREGLGFQSTLGLEIPNVVLTPYVEHNMLLGDIEGRFTFGLRYYF